MSHRRFAIGARLGAPAGWGRGQVTLQSSLTLTVDRTQVPGPSLTLVYKSVFIARIPSLPSLYVL